MVRGSTGYRNHCLPHLIFNSSTSDTSALFLSALPLPLGESGKAAAEPQSVGFCSIVLGVRSGYDAWKDELCHLLSYTSIFFLTRLTETTILFPLFSFRIPAPNLSSREIVEATPSHTTFLLLLKVHSA